MKKFIFYVQKIYCHEKLPAVASILVVGFISFCCCPDPAAAAFDPETAVKKVISFFQLLIVAAAAYLAITMIGKGNIVPAIISVLGGAFLYVIIDPPLMKDLGNGIKDLIVDGGSAGGAGGDGD